MYTLKLHSELQRIADALERLSPPPPEPTDFSIAEAYIWQAQEKALVAVSKVNCLALELLQTIDTTKEVLLENTQRFAQGLPSNNALLWGARGMGKSSLVKAVHGHVNAILPDKVLKLVEIHKDDVSSLPKLLKKLPNRPWRFIVFCDDLSFNATDDAYKSLKTILEGGIEGRPENVLFYATSNRRHLLPRQMSDNEQSSAINPGEAIEETISLSDRFGLWLGFHACSQHEYLEIIRKYASYFGFEMPIEALDAQALAWSIARGARSGRTAWQFFQDIAGRQGHRLS